MDSALRVRFLDIKNDECCSLSFHHSSSKGSVVVHPLATMATRASYQEQELKRQKVSNLGVFYPL
jgi:hypothetical protein